MVIEDDQIRRTWVNGTYLCNFSVGIKLFYSKNLFKKDSMRGRVQLKWLLFLKYIVFVGKSENKDKLKSLYL